MSPDDILWEGDSDVIHDGPATNTFTKDDFGIRSNGSDLIGLG